MNEHQRHRPSINSIISRARSRGTTVLKAAADVCSRDFFEFPELKQLNL
jgi:hypothetical protein